MIKKSYTLLLNQHKISYIYLGITTLGLLFVYSQNYTLIIIGFILAMFGIHELGHVFALSLRKYKVIGLTISIIPPGIGSMPDRPIEFKDKTIVYFSGFISLVIPFSIFYFSLRFGLLMLLGCIILSTVDIWYWFKTTRN
jgi:hypothetical protein